MWSTRWEIIHTKHRDGERLSCMVACIPTSKGTNRGNWLVLVEPVHYDSVCRQLMRESELLVNDVGENSFENSF